MENMLLFFKPPSILFALKELKKPIHLLLVPGNNRDSMIHMGARVLLESIGEYSVPFDDARSVVIVYQGILSHRELDSLEGFGLGRIIERAKNKELVLLPFSTLPGNAKLLADRSK